MMRISDTVKHLLIINVIMFIGTIAIGDGVLFYDWFAMHFPKNEAFKPWQIFTHMFMHGGLTHILFNMFALWMFGTAVEQVFGTKKFVTFYLLAGFGAVALSFAVYYFQAMPLVNEIAGTGYPEELIHKIINLDISDGSYLKGEILERKMIPLITEAGLEVSKISNEQFAALFELNALTRTRMVGASGAIFGIFVAFGMLYPNAKLMLIFLPIPIKAKYFIPAIVGLDIISAFTGQSFFSPSNTAYAAHIGGALTGFLMMYFWKKNQYDKFRWN